MIAFENGRLPRGAYTDQSWFEKEQAAIVEPAWTFACTPGDLPKPGDYLTLTVGRYPLAILRDKRGDLRAFHNVCRHRGAALLEGRGQVGTALVCPYHRWTYTLEGALRGAPDMAECFPGLQKGDLGLKPAALGVLGGLVFIHPDPDADFDAWTAPLSGLTWPHDLSASDAREDDPLVYDVACNWKVFVENAIDGYHLAYLHEHTLGGPKPDQNVWERAGPHMLWYAAEGDGRSSIPAAVHKMFESAWASSLNAAEADDFAGVYYLWPTTIITATPYGLATTMLEPVSPGRTLLHVRSWQEKGLPHIKLADVPGYDPETGTIRSEKWTTPALESGDFQSEDVWICEQIQRGLNSLAYDHGPLSQGPGAEDPIRWFAEQVREAMPD